MRQGNGREYVIYVSTPPAPYNKALGNRRYNAYPTFGRPLAAGLLGPDVVHYDIVIAVSKAAAVAIAQRRWSQEEE